MNLYSFDIRTTFDKNKYKYYYDIYRSNYSHDIVQFCKNYPIEYYIHLIEYQRFFSLLKGISPGFPKKS